MPRLDLSLYVILDRTCLRRGTVRDVTAKVIAGGATCLQVRLKESPASEIMDFASGVIEVARKAGVPVIINDRVDIAIASSADGVHLGEDDLPVAWARRIAGKNLTIGASASDVDSAFRAARDGADYIGVGPVFPTPAKPEATPVPAGTIAAIRKIISLPIVAIGGINQDNLIAPLEEGADGIAVISALHQCLCPGESTAKLRRALDQAKKR